METLVGFREKEENRLLYESRLAYTREQRTREREHRRTLEALEAAHQQLEREKMAASCPGSHFPSARSIQPSTVRQ